MKYLTGLCIMLFLVVSCSTSPESVIVAYEREHNSHDVNGALAFFDDDITFESKGVWIKEGKDEMRMLEEWDSTLNSNLKFTHIRENADSVYCAVVESNDWFRAIGIDNIRHDPVILVLDDSKIEKIIAIPSIESGEVIQSAIKEITDWSAANGDSTIFSLIKNGQFVYSKEHAKTWLALLENWNASRTGQE